MIYPIPPETDFFCWFAFNGCCNSTAYCGVPPIAYVSFIIIALFAFIEVIVHRRKQSQKKEDS
jgi:hypothetical protein